jgi:hypothetical protein
MVRALIMILNPCHPGAHVLFSDTKGHGMRGIILTRLSTDPMKGGGHSILTPVYGLGVDRVVRLIAPSDSLSNN